MMNKWLICVPLLCMPLGLSITADLLGQEAQANTFKDDAAQTFDSATAESNGVAIAAARARAQVMHDVYAATLEVLHHRYFHRDRAIIPARAMQDIFDELERQSKTEARWISASLKPMSVDHEPTSDFEKRASKEIAAGTQQLEVVEDGYYRLAGAIPLSDGCVGCHGGFFKPQSKKPKFAGLVISVPLDASDQDGSK